MDPFRIYETIFFKKLTWSLSCLFSIFFNLSRFRLRPSKSESLQAKVKKTDWRKSSEGKSGLLALESSNEASILGLESLWALMLRVWASTRFVGLMSASPKSLNCFRAFYSVLLNDINIEACLSFGKRRPKKLQMVHLYQMSPAFEPGFSSPSQSSFQLYSTPFILCTRLRLIEI